LRRHIIIFLKENLGLGGGKHGQIVTGGTDRRQQRVNLRDGAIVIFGIGELLHVLQGRGNLVRKLMRLLIPAATLVFGGSFVRLRRFLRIRALGGGVILGVKQRATGRDQAGGEQKAQDGQWEKGLTHGISCSRG